MLVLAGAAAWYFLMGPGGEARRRAAAAADSAQALAAADSARLADSARAAAALPTTGFVRVTGDLPDDAIISVNGEPKDARTFALAPGTHTLEVESSEFEPFERRITVRIGDTTRVFVELELKSDSTEN